MTKYKVGDEVKVRTDLIIDRLYSMENSPYTNDFFIDCMSEYAGQNVTIAGIIEEDNKVYYEIVEDDGAWCWTDGMFE